jgi:hypothetical protein
MSGWRNLIATVNLLSDGLMRPALHLYRMHRLRILDAGYTIPVVAARGPLRLASLLRGVLEFMIDIAGNPEGVHKLLSLTWTGLRSTPPWRAKRPAPDVPHGQRLAARTRGRRYAGKW